MNTTLLSLFSFILLLRFRPGRLSPRTSARLGLCYAKVNVLIIQVKSFYSKTLSKTLSRPRSAGRRPGSPSENCLWRSLCVLGASRILSLQKRCRQERKLCRPVAPRRCSCGGALPAGTGFQMLLRRSGTPCCSIGLRPENASTPSKATGSFSSFRNVASLGGEA